MKHKNQGTSRIRRLLDRAFPPHEELAIFSAAVCLVALAIMSPDFRSALYFVGYFFLIEYPKEGFAESIWKGLWSVFGGYAFVLSILASLGMSLKLPFTMRRMDVFVELMIIIHILLIFASNLLAFNENQNFFSGLIFSSSFLYLFFFFVGIRFRFLYLRVSDLQATAQQGFVAAAVASLLVFLLAVGFRMHWAHCYAISTVVAIGMARIIERRDH